MVIVTIDCEDHVMRRCIPFGFMDFSALIYSTNCFENVNRAPKNKSCCVCTGIDCISISFVINIQLRP